jgi:hypothetical protein
MAASANGAWGKSGKNRSAAIRRDNGLYLYQVKGCAL